MDYQLEIKQIVDYPRCRIYREFIRNLMSDMNICTNGSSYLYYYTLFCSYANFRTSYQKFDGITYIVAPGEWICRTSDLSKWFHTRFQHQSVSILNRLQENHYITYQKLGRGSLVKFTITDWKHHNTALDYNYPCLKDVGFFFFPIASFHELISMGKCSEMDIVLDLWLYEQMVQCYNETIGSACQTPDEKEQSCLNEDSAVAVIYGYWHLWSITEHLI